jgi:hypothetical protein
MIRILLGVVLPLLAPTLLYFLYVLIVHWLRPGRTAGAATSPPDPLRNAPWLWLLGVGVALMAAGLVFVAEFDREPPGGTYVPPQLIDGVVVPGHVIPAPDAGEGE